MNLRIPSLVLAVLVAGCSTYGPSQQLIGQDRNALIAQLGPPTAEIAQGQESRLEYARGPYGRHTYFITLDREGRIKQWEQVLHPNNFQKIAPGMTKADVLNVIGQSFEVSLLGRTRGEVWSYRYETPLCVWFQIEFSQDGVIRSAGDGIPPECLGRRWSAGL
jgi:hypothetical protein